MPIDTDSRSRKWQVTINNPVDKGFTHGWLRELLGGFKSLVYWCMSDEIGENGTFHTHIYMACSEAVRFSTLKKRFEGAHFEMARGTSQQNRDYVFKEGKWEKDKKKETNLVNTHEEYGQMPIESQGQRNDLTDLYDRIKSGMSDYEILEECPQYLFQIDRISRARQTVKENEFKDSFRNIVVTYVFGATGSGKTRTIMEEYGYSKVFRVTDYDHPFDGYHGQDVIVFEEFRSGLKIQDMLNYLDGYPLELPCRYANKVACYTKVYIVTNLPPDRQYEIIQQEHQETWKAFKRRIHKIKEYSALGVHEYSNIDNYSEQLSLRNIPQEWLNVKENPL